jgi:hypothetical protein
MGKRSVSLSSLSLSPSLPLLLLPIVRCRRRNSKNNDTTTITTTPATSTTCAPTEPDPTASDLLHARVDREEKETLKTGSQLNCATHNIRASPIQYDGESDDGHALRPRVVAWSLHPRRRPVIHSPSPNQHCRTCRAPTTCQNPAIGLSQLAIVHQKASLCFAHRPRRCLSSGIDQEHRSHTCRDWSRGENADGGVRPDV